jgi:hypothetical protein
MEASVRPDVLAVALLDEIAERLLSVERLLAKPKGYVHPIKVTVTGLKVIDFVNDPPRTPLFAVSIFNDGPDDVYPGVNGRQTYTPLRSGEPLTLEFHTPCIRRLVLDVLDGGRADVRGFGMY